MLHLDDEIPKRIFYENRHWSWLYSSKKKGSFVSWIRNTTRIRFKHANLISKKKSWGRYKKCVFVRKGVLFFEDIVFILCDTLDTAIHFSLFSFPFRRKKKPVRNDILWLCSFSPSSPTLLLIACHFTPNISNIVFANAFWRLKIAIYPTWKMRVHIDRFIGCRLVKNALSYKK